MAGLWSLINVTSFSLPLSSAALAAATTDFPPPQDQLQQKREKDPFPSSPWESPGFYPDWLNLGPLLSFSQPCGWNDRTVLTGSRSRSHTCYCRKRDEPYPNTWPGNARNKWFLHPSLSPCGWQLPYRLHHPSLNPRSAAALLRDLRSSQPDLHSQLV